MPRPRQGVTQANLLNVDRYFYYMLRDNRLFTDSSIPGLSLQYDAKEAFKALPPINWKNESERQLSMAERREALQNWIDKYVPAKKWQRCLLTLRQHKYRKKQQLKRLDISLETHLTIKLLAEKQHLSINEVIHKLAKSALQKICKNELRKKAG